ncbi:hypothetical protein F4805DRAFT_442527 [Annulohypoxylon moriforme]|nr:hypothetical protein F4805DRAFT_442527 [Annulohypoxylon moriforme]
MDSSKFASFDASQAGKPAPPSQPSRIQLSRKAYFNSLFILSSLSAITSIIELALAAEGAKRGPPADPSDIKGRYFTAPTNMSLLLSEYPADLFTNQDELKTGSASFSLICAVVTTGIAWRACVTGPIRSIFILRQALVAVLGLNSILSLATFLYSFITHGLSAHFSLSFAFEIANPRYLQVYDQGTFDLETWACETKDLPNHDLYPEGQMHTLCSVETGARVMTIFVFLLAFFLFVFVYLDRRGEKRLMVTWKSRRASWREDYY